MILHGPIGIALRGKNLRFFILEKSHPSIVHRDIGFCQTVKTKPTPNLAFQPVGVGIACQIGSKTLRPVVQQPVFGANA